MKKININNKLITVALIVSTNLCTANENSLNISTFTERMRTPKPCPMEVIDIKIENNKITYHINNKGHSNIVPELFITRKDIKIIDNCLTDKFNFNNNSRCMGIKYATGINGGKSLNDALYYFKIASSNGDVWSSRQIPSLIASINGAKSEITIFELSKLAENNNDFAMLYLALIYDNADNKSKENMINARKFYKMSSDSGNYMASCNLGVLYSTGNVKFRNYNLSRHFFKIAADYGEVQAKSNLGLLFELGKGGSINIPQAIKLYEEGLEENNASSISNLASLHERGIGVTKDTKIAFDYFTKAAELGDEFAKHKINKR